MHCWVLREHAKACFFHGKTYMTGSSYPYRGMVVGLSGFVVVSV